MTGAKKRAVTIFDYENPRLKGFNVTVPLRSESGDMYSFVLDLGADGYGTKELAMNLVANAQVWHQRLDPLYAQSLDILRKLDGTGIILEGAVSDCDDLLRDVRDYTDVLEFTVNIPANYENASGVSADPQVQGLVD